METLIKVGSRRCNPRRSARPRRGVPRASRCREKTGSVAPRLSRPPHPRPFSPGNTGGEGRTVACEQCPKSESQNTKTGIARNAFQTNDLKIFINPPQPRSTGSGSDHDCRIRLHPTWRSQMTQGCAPRTALAVLHVVLTSGRHSTLLSRICAAILSVRLKPRSG